MTTTYRCPRCTFTYDLPMAVLWVSHDCKPHDRKATHLAEEPGANDGE